jgi:hypothetical protein
VLAEILPHAAPGSSSFDVARRHQKRGSAAASGCSAVEHHAHLGKAAGGTLPVLPQFLRDGVVELPHRRVLGGILG